MYDVLYPSFWDYRLYYRRLISLLLIRQRAFSSEAPPDPFLCYQHPADRAFDTLLFKKMSMYQIN